MTYTNSTQHVRLSTRALSMVTSKIIEKNFSVTRAEIEHVSEKYPLKIPDFYFSLIKSKNDPLYRQAVPDAKELINDNLPIDPFCEQSNEPVPFLIHRYPDRALFIVSTKCAMHCRFCLRKRFVGIKKSPSKQDLLNGVNYIKENKNISEVVLSGGDPLLLEFDILENILSKLKKIPHIQNLRIHTRVPCVLPNLITPNLAKLLSKFVPLFIIVQFNHPAELTKEAKNACDLLANVGIPLGSQSVLLKNVNDNALILKDLFKGLLKFRVRPYYLHHPDLVHGTQHFRVPIESGLNILNSLRGAISGIAIPHYMIDLPGGGGKVPMLPEYIVKKDNGFIWIRNFQNKVFRYPIS